MSRRTSRAMIWFSWLIASPLIVLTISTLWRHWPHDARTVPLITTLGSLVIAVMLISYTRGYVEGYNLGAQEEREMTDREYQ